MRPLRLAAVLLALPISLLAQSEGVAEFEGQSTLGPGQTMPSRAKIYTARPGVRVEMQIGTRKDERAREGRGAVPAEVSMLMITRVSEPDKVYFVNDAAKTYSVLRSKDTSKTGTKYSARRLGRDTVAGFSCEKASLTSDDGSRTDLCVTRDLVPSSSWLSAMNRGGGEDGMAKALRDNGLDGFPIRWVVYGKAETTPTSTFELVRFEKKSLPSSLFEVPAGYEETGPMGAFMTPEQQKAVEDALKKMSPEQRKAYEEMMKKSQTPNR